MEFDYLEVGGGSIPTDLQEASVNVYTNSVCKNTWGNDITSGMVCVGDKSKGHGSCNVSAPVNVNDPVMCLIL